MKSLLTFARFGDHSPAVPDYLKAPGHYGVSVGHRHSVSIISSASADEDLQHLQNQGVNGNVLVLTV